MHMQRHFWVFMNKALNDGRQRVTCLSMRGRNIQFTLVGVRILGSSSLNCLNFGQDTLRQLNHFLASRRYMS